METNNKVYVRNSLSIGSVAQPNNAPSDPQKLEGIVVLENIATGAKIKFSADAAKKQLSKPKPNFRLPHEPAKIPEADKLPVDAPKDPETANDATEAVKASETAANEAKTAISETAATPKIQTGGKVVESGATNTAEKMTEKATLDKSKEPIKSNELPEVTSNPTKLKNGANEVKVKASTTFVNATEATQPLNDSK